MLIAIGPFGGMIICAVSVIGLLGVDIALYALAPSDEETEYDDADLED
jgi:hypothetical protein